MCPLERQENGQSTEIVAAAGDDALGDRGDFSGRFVRRHLPQR